MRRAVWTAVLAVGLAALLAFPCTAGAEELKQALPEEAGELLAPLDPGSTDVKSGFSLLWQGALDILRRELKGSVQTAFWITAVCLLLSLLTGFARSAGISLPQKAPELAGVTAILLLAMGQSGALLHQCRQVISSLDRFTKLLTTVFAIASAAAGRPASGAAAAGAAMLFSDVILTLSLKVFLPLITLYLLMIYGGIVSENPALYQAAGVGKWAVTTFFKVFLTAYFAYLSFTGLVTGTADAAAVKAAQSLSSSVPLVGSVIAGASETILSGAAVVRAGVGLFGFLGAVAICLTPFLQGVCHLLVFRVLSVFAASFAEGEVKRMLDGLAGAYRMLVGILSACCAVQFITIVVSMTVTGT